MAFQLQNIQEGWKQAVAFLLDKLKEDDASDFAFLCMCEFSSFSCMKLETDGALKWLQVGCEGGSWNYGWDSRSFV